MPPGAAVIELFAAVQVGVQMENLQARAGQFHDPGGRRRAQREANRYDRPRVRGPLRHIRRVRNLDHSCGLELVQALAVQHRRHKRQQFRRQCGGGGRGHHGQRLQLPGRLGARPRVRRRHFQNRGKLDLQQARGRREHPAVRREGQAHRFRADVHAGGDVLAAVNSVARGAHDLGHVGPDGIEPRAVESPSISGPGNWDAAVVGLVPGGQQDVGLPVFVATFQELRVYRDVQQSLGAALHAGQTGLALVQQLDRRQRVAIVGRLGLVDVVAAAELDAVGAAGAVLAPIDVAELAHATEARGRRRGVDVVAIGHLRSRPTPLVASRRQLAIRILR